MLDCSSTLPHHSLRHSISAFPPLDTRLHVSHLQKISLACLRAHLRHLNLSLRTCFAASNLHLAQLSNGGNLPDFVSNTVPVPRLLPLSSYYQSSLRLLRFCSTSGRFLAIGRLCTFLIGLGGRWKPLPFASALLRLTGVRPARAASSMVLQVQVGKAAQASCEAQSQVDDTGIFQG